MAEHVTYTIYNTEWGAMEVTGARVTKDFAIRWIESRDVFVLDHIRTGVCWPFCTVEDAVMGATLLQGAWSDFDRRDTDFITRHAKVAPQSARDFCVNNQHPCRLFGGTPFVVGVPVTLPKRGGRDA